MLGDDWHPTRPKWRVFGHLWVVLGIVFQIYPTRIYIMKLDYISSLLPQIGYLQIICGSRYLGLKSAIFSIFFDCSNLTFEILIVEENFFGRELPKISQNLLKVTTK